MAKLLIAASLAFAFTPPTGWTPVPSYFIVSPTVWESSTATNADTIFLVRVAAQSGGATTRLDDLFRSILPSLFRSAAASGGSDLHYASSTLPICGSTAQVMTIAGPRDSEIIFEGGSAPLLLMYQHAGAATEEHFLHTFCPPASADLATLAPPPGWIVKPSMRIVAEWYGPSIGELLVESQGPLMSTLDAALALVGTPSAVAVHHGSISLDVTKTTSAQTCGAPAVEETMTLSGPNGRTITSVLVVQGASASYALQYTTRQPSPDATVLAAMRAFCPN